MSLNRFKIVHCPGKIQANAEWDGFYNDSENIKFKISDQLSVVSVMNESCLKKSYLAKQFNSNNLTLIIPESTRKICNWKNTYKIDGILEALDKITTPYTLILDGRDVKVLGDLDDYFLDMFDSFNADIVFNGSDGIYPKQKLENEFGNAKLNKYKYFNYPFINAGVCIGKTDKLKEFYSECKNWIKVNNYNELEHPSEQWVVRNVATNTNVKIDTDSSCLFFTYYHIYKRFEKIYNKHWLEKK